MSVNEAKAVDEHPVAAVGRRGLPAEPVYRFQLDVRGREAIEGEPAEGSVDESVAGAEAGCLELDRVPAFELSFLLPVLVGEWPEVVLVFFVQNRVMNGVVVIVTTRR